MDDEAVIGTALGPWRLRWTRKGLCGFRPSPGPVTGVPASVPAWVREAAGILKRHLDGERQDLSNLPLDLSGLSSFQRAVADALRLTRRGTITYGDLAALAGRPGAAPGRGPCRARQSAPGARPLPPRGGRKG